MSAAVIERVQAAEVDSGDPASPVHMASLGRSVLETLRFYTEHIAFSALDDLAFEAVELLHVAVTKRDADTATQAVIKIEQVVALGEIMEKHDQSGHWESLGAALHLMRAALQLMNVMRRGWE